MNFQGKQEKTNTVFLLKQEIKVRYVLGCMFHCLPFLTTCCFFIKSILVTKIRHDDTASSHH